MGSSVWGGWREGGGICRLVLIALYLYLYWEGGGFFSFLLFSFFSPSDSP